MAQRGGRFGLKSVGPAEDRRLGFRCHDGQRRRLRVRSNLPSGLLMARRKLAGSGSSLSREILVLLMNPPEGMPGRARPGGKSPPVSIHSGGMVSREGGGREVSSTNQLNYESRPGVLRSSLLEGRSAKSALGCLTYSRIWCLSRGKHNIL